MCGRLLFCKLRIRLKRSMARSRRRNGRYEFWALLFGQRPVSCLLAFPTTFIAAPKVTHIAVDLHENFVQMPLPVGPGSQPLDAVPTGLGRDHRTKPVPPEADGFVAQVNVAFMKRIFGIQK